MTKILKRGIQSGWYSWRKIIGVFCDKRVSEKVKRKMYIDNSMTNNVVWHANSRNDQEAGRKNGSGINEDVEILVESDNGAQA